MSRRAMRGCARLAPLVATAALTAACQPTLVDEPWRVRGPRVVAVRATPPEASPGTEVMLEAVGLSPGPAGSADPASNTGWSVCRRPKPLAESRVVDPACLFDPVDQVGNPVKVTLPADGCALFGPDPAQPAPGEPPTRPRDPDATGGFYQPITVQWGDEPTVALVRISCDLPQASGAVAREFRARYSANQSPVIADLALQVGDGSLASPWELPPGTSATLTLTPDPFSAEAFPVFDPLAGVLVDQREALAVSWWITGGTLSFDARDPADASTVLWRAPDEAGTVEIVAVLRDSRGGQDVRRSMVVVR